MTAAVFVLVVVYYWFLHQLVFVDARSDSSRGHPYQFKAYHPPGPRLLTNDVNVTSIEEDWSSTWLVVRRNTSACPEAAMVLEKGQYIVNRTEYQPMEGDEIAEWTARHKLNPNTTYPVTIRCATSCALVFGQERPGLIERFTPTRWRLYDGCGYNLMALTDEDEVLWIDPVVPIRSHSYDALQVMYQPAPPADYTTTLGHSITIAVLDTDLDFFNAAFYDPNNPTPRLGDINPSNHSKVASYITAQPGVTGYSCVVDGCHGTFVAGAAAGSYVSVAGETGIAPATRLAFYAMARIGTNEVLDAIPSGLYNYLMDVCSIGGATIISISWGSYDTTGAYDDMSDLLDEVSRARPYCTIVVACGNSGVSGKCASPATGKNVIPVGASFSRPEAYTSYWSDPLVHPERYQWNVVASFSSTGPLADGRRAPLFFSPGVFEFLPYGLKVPTANHIHYAAISGTSFSAPNLAGLVAEVQRRFNATFGSMPTFEMCDSILITLAQPMSGAVMDVYSNVGAIPNTNHPPLMAFGFPKLPTAGLGTDVWAIQDSVANGDSKRGYCAYAKNATLPITIGIAWRDVPGTGLINDLDMRVFYNQTSVYPMYWDGVNPNERIVFTASDVTKPIRVVVYETDGVVVQTTQPFAMFWTNVASVWECGTCFGFDQQSCSVAGYQLCNVTDGTFLPTCYPTVNATCPTGYYNVTNTCQCQPGTETPCPISGADAVKQCQADGLTYSSCYSRYLTAETSLKSINNQPAATGDAIIAKGPTVVTILFLLILVL